jgi:glyoxylase-like metal-dependent hydrolase (beta-lactamase superfamily II)
MLKVMIAPVTPFQQNCSIVWDDETMEGSAVDPGGDFDMLKHAIDEQGIKVTKVLLTHGHVDHASAAGTMAEHYGVKIEGPHRDDLFLIEGLPESGAKYNFPAYKPFVPDRWLENGDTVALGNLTFDVVHCPGHTPGHVVFVHRPSRIAFVGDVLFRGSIGRTAITSSCCPRSASGSGRSATTRSSCRATDRPRPSAGSARPTPMWPTCCSTIR